MKGKKDWKKKYPVGLTYGGNLGFSFGFIGWILIGLPSRNQRLVCLGNICKGCCFRDSKNAVKICWRWPWSWICHHRQTDNPENREMEMEKLDVSEKDFFVEEGGKGRKDFYVEMEEKKKKERGKVFLCQNSCFWSA